MAYSYQDVGSCICHILATLGFSFCTYMWEVWFVLDLVWEWLLFPHAHICLCAFFFIIIFNDIVWKKSLQQKILCSFYSYIRTRIILRLRHFLEWKIGIQALVLIKPICFILRASCLENTCSLLAMAYSENIMLFPFHLKLSLVDLRLSCIEAQMSFYCEMGGMQFYLW